MPILYLYAASDFITGLPNEARDGGAAVGSPPFTITLSPEASPVAVEVNDTDGVIDEITTKGPQTFTNEATIGGVVYPAGTSYHGAYDLLNSSTGHKVTALHLGGTGYETGPVHVLVSSVPLVAGTAYTFDENRTSFKQADNTYDSYASAPCFARSTLIKTDHGDIAVEDLREGDLVVTRDSGLQPIRWIESYLVDAHRLEQNENLRPVRISRHALGMNTPSSDLIVSPQHRILVRSKIAQRMFGTDEVLVAAKQLCQVDGIDIAYDLNEVEYFHLLFDQHEVVLSNGAETESLYTGPEALKSVGESAREEIFTIFPELKDRDYSATPARILANGRMGRKLAARHQQNAKRLIS